MEQERFVDVAELRMLARAKAQHHLHQRLPLVKNQHTAHVYGFTTLDLLSATLFAQEANLLLASQPYRTVNSHILFFTPTSRLQEADVVVGFRYDDNNNPANVRDHFRDRDSFPRFLVLTPEGTDWKPAWE
ncbi:hypothetical protein F862_gp068 [Vibrio phage vB_VpaS_MAR10]|uniref:Uncharacterized protein n=1 Tax=Vibrio phage vB_VpaS_MAR10 TaxID=1229755 RepID=K7RVQ5_9CAUD|nr:hypothetical protein F862_gp068 [Vibrio phage vB_VpaS_MAR10]AFV81300.1 hypothetical protein MAR10_066 [Vibrio phage vB_VpaS_MAR10]